VSRLPTFVSEGGAANARAETATGTTVDLASLRETVYEPTRGRAALNLRELWQYRELLYFFVWRAVKVRYKQTTVGVLWALLQPLLISVLFAVIFGHFAKLPSDGEPYLPFVYTGMLPWFLFSSGFAAASAGLVSDKELITQVYFPRLIVPLSSVIASVVDFAIASIALVAMMAIYGIHPHATFLALPAFVLLAILTTLAVGIWFSALNVQYRDVQYTVPFLTQFLLFATPVAYSSSLLPAKYQFIYGLNPMAGVVEGFRWAVFNSSETPRPLTLVSLMVVIVVLVSGIAYFRTAERTFADVI
jgi:homopolymeric O-antigen transport system permease protein